MCVCVCRIAPEGITYVFIIYKCARVCVFVSYDKVYTGIRPGSGRWNGKKSDDKRAERIP